ncbi:glycoside hydrolase family 2, partial [Candidatus Bathyarchaeota archaeon]
MNSTNSGNLPRPEYPRPDFRRDAWLNLNGLWDFRFDNYDLGESERWYLGEKDFDKKILVPFPFQSKLSGIHDESFHDIVWYRREFSIPEDWKGRRILLHFGAVDYETKVWLNKRFLGSNVGGYVPFYFDITDYLKERNLLILRVYDPHGDQPRGKQSSKLHPSGVHYMRITGIWQTVWLEPVGDAYLTSCRVITDIEKA